MAAKRAKLPAAVLERAKTASAAKRPAPALARPRQDTKQKVIAALRKLHPMD